MTKDPLEILGPAIFLHVLHSLPVRELVIAERVSRSWHACIHAHSRGLWRAACGAVKVELQDIRRVEDEEIRNRAGINGDECEAEEDEEERETEEVAQRAAAVTGVADWRSVCRAHVSLQNAWKHARCDVRWITPPNNTVWRIKIDHEQHALVTTSRLGGLTVVDLSTSIPLFSIRGVRTFAHVEAGRGFIVFDRSQEGCAILEVWRSGAARARSSHPPAEPGSPLVNTVHSHSNPQFLPGRDVDLPRGHFEYFRSLRPPSECFAFRLHVDDVDGPNPRAILATAGETAVYIFHIEEQGRMETIPIMAADQSQVNYIEVDDEYVFLCGQEQMRVYSRITAQLVVSFPPRRTPARDAAAYAFPLSLADDFMAPPRASSRPWFNRGSRSLAPIGIANVDGAPRGDPAFDVAIARGIAMHSIRWRIDALEILEYGFSACHYTTTDLVCTAKTGAIFVVRDYRALIGEVEKLAIGDRAAAVALNTMIIGLGTPVRQLSTYGDHIVACTPFNVIVFNSNQFPSLPFNKRHNSPLRAHVLLGNHPQAVKMSSCVQADAEAVYLTYWAMGEVDALGGAEGELASWLPPFQAVEGFGVCVKVWSFAPDVPDMPNEEVTPRGNGAAVVAGLATTV